MYRSYWRLRERPFPTALDPASFHRSPTHDEALARLHFLVDEGRRLGLLVGRAGSGKSLLLEVLAGELRRTGCRVARLSLLGVDARELLWRLAADWGLNPNRSASLFDLWRAAADGLAAHCLQRLQSVILLDDADEADWEVLGQVTRLSQHSLTGDTRLTLVLACRNDRLGNLGCRLLDLAELRIEIEAWEQCDTQNYVREALARAGRQKPAFAADALLRLHELAQGVPRRINQLADLALVAAAGRQLPLVDAHTVETVFDELGVAHAVAPAG